MLLFSVFWLSKARLRGPALVPRLGWIDWGDRRGGRRIVTDRRSRFIAQDVDSNASRVRYLPGSRPGGSVRGGRTSGRFWTVGKAPSTNSWERSAPERQKRKEGIQSHHLERPRNRRRTQLAMDIFDAATSGDIGRVVQLVEEVGDEHVFLKNTVEYTPLHFAAQRGRYQISKYLLTQGADPNARNFIDKTPLHLAAFLNNADCCELLLQHGAQIGAEDKFGRTPYQIAKENGYEETLRVLERYGQKLDWDEIVLNRDDSILKYLGCQEVA
eukprot:scaffold358_cov343-Pavlova_lutheri.AAC.52